MSTFEGVNDWDLQAVIRGWTRNNDHDEFNMMNNMVDHIPSSNYGNLASLDFHHHEYDNIFHSETNLVVSNELEDVYKQFSMQLLPEPDSSIQVSPVVSDHELKVAETMKQETVSVEAMLADQPRRRRNKHKIKVIHQESKDGILPMDEWNWRKYGQKPIKGSPHPRSYYRCSSLQGCLARKQVEESITNPGIYIITHIAEHNHPHPTRRYSQAGRTINKFPSSSSSSLPPKTNSNTTLCTTTSNIINTTHPYYCSNLIRTMSAPESMLRTIEDEANNIAHMQLGSSSTSSALVRDEGTTIKEEVTDSIWDDKYFPESQEYWNGMCMDLMNCGGSYWT